MPTNSILAHVRRLAAEIGPRGTGTPAERQAADYAAGCLEGWGLPFERLTCRTILSMNHYPLAVNALGLLALALYPLGSPLLTWLAVILALLVAPFMALTIRTSSNPLRPLLPKCTSPSVLGKVEPAGALSNQVVLLAHLDSNKCRLTWDPKRLGTLEPLTWTTLGLQAFFGLALLAGALAGLQREAWLAALLPGTYMLSIVITLILDDFTPYSPGANDNASSVGVALEIAREFSRNPLAHTRLWLAFTGAEETDHYGLRSILDAHPDELQQALFIDLEGVGAGELVCVTRHGIGLRYTPDPGLLTLAQEVAEEHPQWGVRGAAMVMSEEVSTLTARGLRAVCIAGRHPQTGALAEWHRASDTVENLDGDALLRAKDYTLALLRRIDSG